MRKGLEMIDAQRMLDLIGSSDDPDKLRSWYVNARKAGCQDVADAAFRRLIAILPEEKPGTVEHDFRQTVHRPQVVEVLLQQVKDDIIALNRVGRGCLHLDIDNGLGTGDRTNRSCPRPMTRSGNRRGPPLL